MSNTQNQGKNMGQNDQANKASSNKSTVTPQQQPHTSTPNRANADTQNTRSAPSQTGSNERNAQSNKGSKNC